MAEFTMHSRKYGDVTFFVPETKRGYEGYVRVDLGEIYEDIGTEMICEHGQLQGRMVQCSPADLEKTARRWWRAYMRAR